MRRRLKGVKHLIEVKFSSPDCDFLVVRFIKTRSIISDRFAFALWQQKKVLFASRFPLNNKFYNAKTKTNNPARWKAQQKRLASFFSNHFKLQLNMCRALDRLTMFAQPQASSIMLMSFLLSFVFKISPAGASLFRSLGDLRSFSFFSAFVTFLASLEDSKQKYILRRITCAIMCDFGFLFC